MSDRLRELLRQRALLQEHLAWLEKEITAALADNAAHPPATPSTAPAPRAAATPPPPEASSAAAAAIAAKIITASTLSAPAASNEPLPVADAILEEYRVEPRSLQQDVRKGCFLYFAAALALLALGVAVLYVAFRTR